MPFQRPVGVALVDDDAGPSPPLELEAVNLSLGGLCIAAERLPPEGARVQLTLAAAGRWLDFAEAEVVWVRRARGRRGRGFGVRFTQLKPNARALVEHLVARGGTALKSAASRGASEHEGARLKRLQRAALAAAVMAGLVATVATVLQRTSSWARASEPPAVAEANAPVESAPVAAAPVAAAPVAAASPVALPIEAAPAEAAPVEAAPAEAAPVEAAPIEAKAAPVAAAEPAPADENPNPPSSARPERSAEREVEGPASDHAPDDVKIALPTGGVTSLRIARHDRDVTITPTLHRGAAIARVFTLSRPARLVIDVTGRTPRYSWQLDGARAVKSLRVGARHHGTRLVVDLPDDGLRYRVASPGA